MTPFPSSPSVLITECLQVDFVKPLQRSDPLPNLLHVGYEEARRLMGDDPATGAVPRTVAWAHAQAADALFIVHVRDWHDPTQPAQAAHLEQFGAHCTAGLAGAGFVFEDPPASREGTEIVDALTLNDFDGSRLDRVLAPLAGQPRRVGLMGVWTEAKLMFLAYELATRYPNFELGVCPALAASSSRAQHYLALDQMSKLLGVRLLGSLGEFTEFLVPGSVNVPLPHRDSAAWPRIGGPGDTSLGAGDRELVAYLFRGCRSVDVTPLSGGFSGSVVLSTQSVDAFGHAEVPHVVKLGSHDAIGRERAAVERIESVLGNSAPRITDWAERGGRGGIRYRYAAMGRGTSSTFARLYRQGLDHDRVDAILRTVFAEQLGTLYAAASRESCSLLQYYEFCERWTASVRACVAAVAGDGCERSSRLELAPGLECANVCRFYEDVLPRASTLVRDTVSFGWVHGDLNGANIVVDPRGNVWIIDFSHVHRGHVLRDLIKLENDLLYIFTPVDDETALQEAARLTDALFSVTDICAPLPPADACGLTSPAIVRAWRTMGVLRSFYPSVLQTDPDPYQLWVGQLRYAVHTLSFEESGLFQKRWALYSAGRCAERITERLS